MTATSVVYATAATRELAEAADRAFADADPLDILGWAARTFGPRLAVASSMADEVVAHLASRAAPGIDVLFLDTGYHFEETLAFRRDVAERLDVTVVDLRPALTVAQQDASFGPALHGRDPDACCAMRKVAPLDLALEGYDAWVSGVRRQESSTRAATPVVGWDARRGKLKINPIAAWDQDRVDSYVRTHRLRYNPLRHLGFASIGCAPCTRPVAADDDPRSGRWSGFDKTECGLHA
jgi:phosphoadenosine phosphosulfate reductase